MTAFSRPELSRFLILYAALYAGFGVQSPQLTPASRKENSRSAASSSSKGSKGHN